MVHISIECDGDTYNTNPWNNNSLSPSLQQPWINDTEFPSLHPETRGKEAPTTTENDTTNVKEMGKETEHGKETEKQRTTAEPEDTQKEATANDSAPENRQPQQMDITTDGKETEQPSTLEPEDTTTTGKAESEKKQATAGDNIPETSTNMSPPNGEGDSNKTKTTPTTQNETTTTISDISEEETDSKIKNSDSEYDPNEIFYARQPIRPKQNLKYSPKRTKKKVKRETSTAPGRSRMFKL